jgi:hypothetical protein
VCVCVCVCVILPTLSNPSTDACRVNQCGSLCCDGVMRGCCASRSYRSVVPHFDTPSSIAAGRHRYLHSTAHASVVAWERQQSQSCAQNTCQMCVCARARVCVCVCVCVCVVVVVMMVVVMVMVVVVVVVVVVVLWCCCAAVTLSRAQRVLWHLFFFCETGSTSSHRWALDAQQGLLADALNTPIIPFTFAQLPASRSCDAWQTTGSRHGRSVGCACACACATLELWAVVVVAGAAVGVVAKTLARMIGTSRPQHSALHDHTLFSLSVSFWATPEHIERMETSTQRAATAGASSSCVLQS